MTTASGSSFELNQGDNFIVAIDVSASMKMTDTPNGMSRIDYAKEQTKAMSREAARFDTSGIDLVTFGARVDVMTDVTPDKADQVIDGLVANQMATVTDKAIQAAWKRAKQIRAAGSTDNITLLMITDGAPSDPQAVVDTIVDITKEMTSDEEFGITFLRVGQDPTIAAYLEKLDDGLSAKGAKFDIVDVQILEDTDFMTAFAGALDG
jgi:uncharacterized protein YegL